MHISRVKRSKQAAREAYNRISHIYDWLAGSSEIPFMRMGVGMLSVATGESVLEIGPGTGSALVELGTQVGPSGKVHGLDISAGMLHQAGTRLKKAGLYERVSLLQGDGAQLPYRNGSFSALFITFTLELFDTPEIPIVLSECQRVLKPHGRLGVVAMFKTQPVSWIVRLYEWFHELLPAYVDCRPINGFEMVQAAGFKLENRQVKSMWGLPVELLVARKA